MPRRPPPSALQLYTGPTPPRSHPKHYLPSLPQPAFYPTKAAPLPAQPTRPRAPSLTMTIFLLSWGSLPSSSEACAKSPVRGPWDHSRNLSESTINVDDLIKLPKPAAQTVNSSFSSAW